MTKDMMTLEQNILVCLWYRVCNSFCLTASVKCAKGTFASGFSCWIMRTISCGEVHGISHRSALLRVRRSSCHPGRMKKDTHPQTGLPAAEPLLAEEHESLWSWTHFYPPVIQRVLWVGVFTAVCPEVPQRLVDMVVSCWPDQSRHFLLYISSEATFAFLSLQVKGEGGTKVLSCQQNLNLGCQNCFCARYHWRCGVLKLCMI